MKKLTFTLLILLAFVEIADAQSFYSRRRDRKWMFSYGIGFSTYHGDLYAFSQDKLQGVNFNAGMGLRRKIGSQLSIRVDLNFYKLQAADSLEHQSGLFPTSDPPDRAQRNLSFRAKNFEFSALAILNLIPVNGSYTRRPILNPYLFLGIGISTNNPEAIYQGTAYKLRPLMTEGVSYGSTTTVIPYGIGLRLKANQFIDILVEIGRRSTSTDRLDDVSQLHVDPSIFDDLHAGDPAKIALAKALTDRAAEAGFPARGPGRIRGHDDKNDAYYIYQIRLEMYLPDGFFKNLFSPTRRKPKFR